MHETESGFVFLVLKGVRVIKVTENNNETIRTHELLELLYSNFPLVVDRSAEVVLAWRERRSHLRRFEDVFPTAGSMTADEHSSIEVYIIRRTVTVVGVMPLPSYVTPFEYLRSRGYEESRAFENIAEPDIRALILPELLASLRECFLGRVRSLERRLSGFSHLSKHFVIDASVNSSSKEGKECRASNDRLHREVAFLTGVLLSLYCFRYLQVRLENVRLLLLLLLLLVGCFLLIAYGTNVLLDSQECRIEAPQLIQQPIYKGSL